MSTDETVCTGRVYDHPAPGDGRRVLVDRLWPRGFRRDDARIDEWVPAVAPSAGLRRWYGHRTERFEEFRIRYRYELATDTETAAARQRLAEAAKKGRITLLTATRDPNTSHVAVLADSLRSDHSADER